MSELKRFDIVGKYADEETMYEFRPDGECYDADEADKVIAKLKTEIEEQKRLRDMALASVPNVLKVMKIIQHQKYKRCINMSKWCFTKSNYHYLVGREEGGQLAKDSFRRSNLYLKWCDRWQKLAEQFKEAK